MELGDKRARDPLGIEFISRHIIWESKEKEKAYKEAQSKARAKRGRRR